MKTEAQKQEQRRIAKSAIDTLSSIELTPEERHKLTDIAKGNHYYVNFRIQESIESLYLRAGSLTKLSPNGIVADGVIITLPGVILNIDTPEFQP